MPTFITNHFTSLFQVFEETRKESPKLVFKDQNLESARNLLRQSLHQRLQSMDRVDGRRSIRGRSLHRQHMQESNTNEQNFDRESLQYRSNRTTLSKPTRPAPPPPLPKRIKNNTISTFTNLRNANSARSQNFDLNSSLNGPKVSYESTTLIRIKNDESQKKPKIPPKPVYLKKSAVNDVSLGEIKASLDRSPKPSLSNSSNITVSNTNTENNNMTPQIESNDIKYAYILH